MKKYLALFASLLLLQSPVWATDLPQDILDSAQKRVDYGLNPGMVIVYLEKGQTPIIKALGKTSLDDEALVVTPQTRFEIGSLTKLFTALEAAYLIEEKKLTLESELKTLWPSKWGALQPGLGGITLSSILSHSSGLPRLPQNFAPAQATDPYQDYELKRLSDFMATFKLDKTPKGYSYSNLAYGMLGALLVPYSHASSYEAMLQKDLLKPLGLSFSSTVDSAKAILAQPHYEGVPVPAWHFSEVTTGAGSLRATGEDMARFLAAQLQPPAGHLGLAIRRSHQVLFEGKEKLAYGWHLREKEGQTIYTHNGLTGGSLSFIGLDLNAGKGAMIMTNNTDAVVDLGLRLLDGKTTLRSLQDIRLSAESLRSYEGQYELAPGTVFKVSQAAGYLRVQLTGQPMLRVYPTKKPHTFKYRVVEATLEFKLNKAGDIDRLVLHQNGQKITALRKK